MRYILLIAVGIVGWGALACAQDSVPTKSDADVGDATALDVLRRVCDVYIKASSMCYEIDMVMYTTDGKSKDKPKDGSRIEAKARIALEKPHLLRIDVESAMPELEGTLVCDGTKVWQYAKKDNRYTVSPVPAEPDLIRATQAGLAPFARQLPLAKDPYAKMVQSGSLYTSQGIEKLDDVECRLIRQASKDGWSMLIWVDKESNLVRQTRLDYPVPGGRQILIMKRSKTRLDPKLSPDMFRFDPPPGSTLVPETPPRTDSTGD